MRVDINAVNFELSPMLDELIQKKVSKLERFYDHIIDCLVFLTGEGPADKFTSRNVEIKVNVKDSTLFCKENAESFEQALDEAVECMKRQLKKYKEKHG